MNWYVVHLLFAQVDADESGNVMCEGCEVLFSAPSALVAYDKGIAWASEHEKDESFRFVGVEHIQSVNEEPGDGVEVGGGFYQDDVWQRRDEIIPEKSQIPVIRLEANSDTPIIELMTEKQIEVAKRVFDSQ